MGLFSSKKKISVSSVVYNLAGAEEDRVQYLPTAVVSGVLAGGNFSMGEVITENMMSGPGIKMRSFGRWARTSGYSSSIGLLAGTVLTGRNLDIDELTSQIPHASGQVVTIQTADIDGADYGYWADRWMVENHPTVADADYEINFSEPLNTIYINFPDGGPSYSFQPVGFNYAAQYLYVSYTISDTPGPGPLVPGPTISVGSPSDYPDTTGWDNLGTTSTPASLVLNETVHTLITYSDDRPEEESETTTPTIENYDQLDTEYELVTYLGDVDSQNQLVTQHQNQHNMRSGTKESNTNTESIEEEIEDGVIKTTTVTTTTESLVYTYSYRVDTQNYVTKAWSGLKVLIYQKNTGNPVFDAMFDSDVSAGTFFPFIPIRLDGRFISPSFNATLYDLNIKAMKKATGAKYDKLVSSIASNESIGDIDYAFAVYGVSLNTAENASKKYLYKFFQTLMMQGGGGVADFTAWQTAWSAANNSVLVWNDWRDAQKNPFSPLFGTPEPRKIAYPSSPAKTIRIRSSYLNYDMRINWSSMQEASFVGVGRAGAKTGDLWWTQGQTVTRVEVIQPSNVGGSGTRDVVTEYVILNWQDSPTTYRSISMWGLRHTNIVYKGKGVNISAKEALGDADESGFIIPLNEAILRGMSLRDSTQMATACTYMVFNCYQVTKKRWYQSSWFKIVIIIVAIVITVVTMGSGAGASAGLLGTAASVGAALGFAGVVAIIVGTIANAIAAMILTRIITAGATALLGDKIGTIVGAIASVVAVAYGSGEMSTTSMASAFSSLSTAKNLLALTLSVGSGISGYINASTKEMEGQIEDLLNTYNSKALAISNAYRDNLGFGKTVFDANQLTNSTSNFMTEAPSTFFARTLLVGSDIATLTNTMITNFASMTTTTELPS